MSESLEKDPVLLKFLLILLICVLPLSLVVTQEKEEEYEKIDSKACIECHETGKHGTLIKEDLSHSIHKELECLDCHIDKNTSPHKEDPGFDVACKGCSSCHEEESEIYQFHGRESTAECEDIPTCAECHGDHDVLPSSVKHSKTHPANLPVTCGKCHEDLNLTKKYEILIDHPIEIYENSVHGKATRGGIYVAATCNDCHSSNETAHKILSPGNKESSINHFNIPKTCGKCHKGVEHDFWEGIHGKLAARGETDAPVCTHCHGEHGIISHDDPRSPVSKSRVAEITCSPCHESIALTEKYGLPTGRLTSFIDSYHGLKSKAGDLHVANCASCHGVHRILPSSDPTSTIYPDNLKKTCGECHPGISPTLAATPIHGIGGKGLQTKAAEIVKIIYIVAIIIIIGLMVLHWLIDLIKQIILVTKKPQVRRMQVGELWQHTLLMLSFIVLVISGFALRFSESWIAKLFFGWERGFELRGTIHRVAAGVLIFVTIWHIFYLFTRRGKSFLKDVMPKITDFREFVQRILYNLGKSKDSPLFKRFSYIEKAEYWALIWGTAVMIITGLLLWFDNYVVKFLPKGFLDVALVIHYYEAILATLAVGIWHLYSTVFSPSVYPMNPSWLTGKMPKEMYEHEHPEEKFGE
ncbi:MAG: cytochrome b/b6 domain-containing protein [Candidatus Aminicenantaceae bacterium]